MTTNFELLKDAAAIIDGIPNEKFNLRYWAEGPTTQCALTKKGECGTLACAGGWLALHPKFNELGLRFKWSRGRGRGDNERNIVYNNDNRVNGFSALAKVFNMPENEARHLFASPAASKYDVTIFAKKGENITHKELFKYRVRNFLWNNDPTWNKDVYVA